MHQNPNSKGRIIYVVSDTRVFPTVKWYFTDQSHEAAGRCILGIDAVLLPALRCLTRIGRRS